MRFTQLLAAACAGAAAAAQCPESRGIFAGSGAAMSVDGSTGGFDSGTLYLKRVGFNTAPPSQWTNAFGPSFRVEDAFTACGAAAPLPDLDAMSLGQDWVLADNATGRVSVPAGRWAAIRFSVTRGTVGRPGSRLAEEVASGFGTGADVFSYVLPGSTLPGDVVSAGTLRAQDRAEIDLGGTQANPPDVDALDDVIPFYDRVGGWPPVLTMQPTFYFSVSAGTVTRVPMSWWQRPNGTPTTRSAATILFMTWIGQTQGQWSCPRVWRTYAELGLAPTEDVDALAIDLPNQRMLFSTKTTTRNPILFLHLGVLAAGGPVTYTGQDGEPISSKIGLLQNDDVDAICAMDPSYPLGHGGPRNPFVHSIGTPFPALFGSPPALSASAYRHAIAGREYFDTHVVGWPRATGVGPGFAVLFFTPDPVLPWAYTILLSVQARNTASMFCGDPRTFRIEIPAAAALTSANYGLRWFAVDARFVEIAEAHPLRITL
jgi:hypothetical protein